MKIIVNNFSDQNFSTTIHYKTETMNEKKQHELFFNLMEQIANMVLENHDLIVQSGLNPEWIKVTMDYEPIS